MRLSDIKRDSAAIEQGAWIGSKHGTPIPGMGDLQLRVRGADNSDWRRLQAKLVSAIPRAKRSSDGRVDPDEMDRIIGSCLVNCCLLDWEGIEDESDPPKPVEYSKAQA